MDVDLINEVMSVNNLNDKVYSMNEAVGIALNGVLLKPAVNGKYVDQIFPRNKNGGDLPARVQLDQCLGSTKAPFSNF